MTPRTRTCYISRVPAPDVFSPVTVGPLTLRNRVVKAATFEGRTPGALVSQQLVDFHALLARGGVGMTTMAYLAVSPEGRTHRDQVFLREAALPGLQRLTEAVHAEGPLSRLRSATPDRWRTAVPTGCTRSLRHGCPAR